MIPPSIKAARARADQGEVNAFAQPSPAPAAGPQLDNRRVLAAIVDLVVIVAGGFALGIVVGLGTAAAPSGGADAR